MIFHDDVENILGPRKWKSRTDEIIEINKKEEEARRAKNHLIDLDKPADKPKNKPSQPVQAANPAQPAAAVDGSADDDAGTPPPFTKG